MCICLIDYALSENYENMRNEIEKSFLVVKGGTSAFKICLCGIFTVLLCVVIIALHKNMQDKLNK